MERLTEYIDDIPMPKFKLYEECKVYGTKEGFIKLNAKLTNKLATYEDTGLEPEEIKRLINKFNLIFSDFSTLYFIREDFNTGENRVHELTIDDEVRVSWHDTSYIYFNATDEYGNYHEVSVDSIGTEYFITEEAAETALKGSESE